MSQSPQEDGDPGVQNVAESEPKALEAKIDDVSTRREENLGVALRLAESGVAVFPVRIEKGERGEWNKIPAVRDWRDAATTDRARVEQWWQEFPEVVAGIALGQRDLVVIDPDRHAGGSDGVAAFETLVNQHGDLPGHPVTITAGGGEHHFFRQNPTAPLGNRSGGLPAGIDVRGAGGFVVAPGAVRPDGARWTAAERAPELTDALRRDAVPIIPDWLVETINRDTSSAPVGGGLSGRRERDYAEAALAGCVAELERTGQGNRNNTLNAVSYRLGRMVACGWLEEHYVVERLTDASAACGLVTDDGETAVRATIGSGLDAGKHQPHPDLSDRSTTRTEVTPALVNSPPTVPIMWDGDEDGKPTEWLVRDMIPVGAIGFLVGESRAGKSFLAVHLAACIGRRDPFFTKRTRLGGTLIFAAEAAGTIPGRLKAARLGPIAEFLDENGRHREDGTEPDKLPVATIRGGIDLLSEAGLRQMIDIANEKSIEMQARAGVPLRLVVIDTTLATFGISNWNDPSEVTRVTNAMARIAQETGATVLGVHHHGKDISRGPAGSYALTAGADFIVSVLCDGDLEGNITGRRIAVTKQREGETGWGCEFSLRQFKIGTDEYGEDTFTAYVEPDVSSAGQGKSRKSKPRPQSNALRTFMASFTEAMDRNGKDKPIGLGGPARAVSIKDVSDVFSDKYEPNSAPGKRAPATSKAFTRGKQEALDTKLVAEINSGGDHWLMPAIDLKQK